MRNVLFLVASLSIVWTSCSSPETHTTDAVGDLMSKMSLDEKVGEMTQLTISQLLEGDKDEYLMPQRGDSTKLYDALVNHHVGSILNVESHDYTVEQWTALHKLIASISSLKPNKIPVLYGIDAIHGTNYTKGATLYPHQIGQAAAWDTVMAKTIGEQTAIETRISGIPWAFSPVLDVARDPRWPRFWETYGESTVLASWMGASYTKGMQGTEAEIDDSHIAVSLKHFLGYSASITGKDRTQAWIAERQLRRYYLPTFAAAIDAGAKTVMINSGDINGIPVHANKVILTDILRGELGFEGLAVTDWADIHYLFNRHRVAKDYKDAVAMAINAGIDMSMVPDDLDFPRLLKECVEEGLVPMSRINESVRRILQVKMDLGLFKGNVKPDLALFNCDEHKATALKAAQNSLVLLKNNHVLPLKKTPMVTGPTANSLIPLNGGWSHSWQGDNPGLANTGKARTIAEAMEARGATYYSSGEDINVWAPTGRLSMASLEGETVVIAFGEWSYCEGVGDIEDMFLPAAQYEMIKNIKERGATVVGVMTTGRPRNIRDVENYFDALLYAPMPGDFGGEAIAGALFGEFNPSGKLPFTYPRQPSSHVTFDHRVADAMGIAAGPSGDKGTASFRPQFEFGHGLSYTTWSVTSKLANVQVNEELIVSVTISNTGNMAGKQTVPVYYEDLVASIVPSVKNLCAFAQIDLAPGEQAVIELRIPRERFALVDVSNKWVVEAGDMKLMVGEDVHDFVIK